MNPRIRIKRGPRTTESDNSETIAFAASFPPALQPGAYTITAQVQLASSDNQSIDQTYNASQAISVYGSRYAFNPQVVVAQYPAPSANGAFIGIIPGIVLNVPTLPWTFTPGDNAPAGASRLGVIVIADSDGVAATGSTAPTPTSMALSAVLATASPVYFPVSRTEPGEDSSQTVQALDLPAALFATLAPLASDLPYLAQARSVTIGDQQQLQCIVLGTRVAYQSGPYTAYLVSLDSYSSALPISDGVLPEQDSQGNVLADYTTFRLVVLSQWRYINSGGAASFSDLAGGLNNKYTSSAALTFTSHSTLQPLQPIPYETTDAVLDLGYIPVPHQMLQGNSTLSFYRGPGTPVPLALDPVLSTLEMDNPDTVLCYDPATGTFDARLAAAWQLGQSLSTSNSRLLAALQSLATAQVQNAAIGRERAVIAGHLGTDTLPAGRGQIKDAIARLLIARLAAASAPRKEVIS